MYQNEQMIDSIYTSQLESVLFSINQYSDDVVSNWANRIEQDLQNPGSQLDSIGRQFTDNNVSVEAIAFADSLDIKAMIIESSLDRPEEDASKNFVEILKSNENEIKRLIQYIDVGYRRIQPIDIELANKSLFLFAYNASDDHKGICGIVVNTERFTSENLGPKIQSVAQDKFYISVFEVATDTEIYSNVIYDESDDKDIKHKKELVADAGLRARAYS